MALRVAILDGRGRIVATNRHWQDMVLAPEHSSISMRVGDQFVTADGVLAAVGTRLQQTMADGDSVARTGDDSFVVLSVGARDESDVVLLASRMLEAVRQPMLVDGREIVLDASIGVALAGSVFVRAADLLSDADIATTEARAQGGGRMALAHQRLRSASVQRLVIEQALRRALE